MRMWNELLTVCVRIGIFWIASITSCLWFMGKFLEETEKLCVGLLISTGERDDR